MTKHAPESKTIALSLLSKYDHELAKLWALARAKNTGQAYKALLRAVPHFSRRDPSRNIHRILGILGLPHHRDQQITEAWERLRAEFQKPEHLN